MPHEVFHVPTENCVKILGLTYLCITVYGLVHCRARNEVEVGEREVQMGDKKKSHGYWHVDEVWLTVFIHYLFYILIVTFSDPTTVRANGMKQVP
jgi:hypothetical protein